MQQKTRLQKTVQDELHISGVLLCDLPLYQSPLAVSSMHAVAASRIDATRQPRQSARQAEDIEFCKHAL